MATTNINIRIDDNLKKDAENLFNYLGLTMSSAITMFLRSAVNNDGIPFELKRHVPNTETLAAIEDVKNGRNLHGPFDSIDKLPEDLNA
ncbi:MAG: type II toxin-antitoxin system RelB/DinJ family antitoxin [Clostridiales bacterium]|nr:type II toxin-antitoxin system RelB/DinJ family antitoxin [Clostridiales bacterium]